MSFQVDDKVVNASEIIEFIDGFLPLAKIWNVGVDAFNGVSKDARGMSTKLYIN
jgi:hypothetical protein